MSVEVTDPTHLIRMLAGPGVGEGRMTIEAGLLRWRKGPKGLSALKLAVPIPGVKDSPIADISHDQVNARSLGPDDDDI